MGLTAVEILVPPSHRHVWVAGEAPPPEYWQPVDDIWAEYQKTHDVRHLDGQAVGIDPVSREVFFGRDAEEVGDRLTSEGRFRPLFFTRVGRTAYGRIRLGRRCKES